MESPRDPFAAAATGLMVELIAMANRDDEIQPLLEYTLPRLANLLDAPGATIRLSRDGAFRLVGSIGIHPQSVIARPAIEQRQFHRQELGNSNRIVIANRDFERSPFNTDGERGGAATVEMIAVPLYFRDSLFGCFQLYRSRPAKIPAEHHALLEKLGYLLGFIMECQSQDNERERLLLVEERARLANELHDSLAQTFAGIRIQLRILDETLHQGEEQVTWEELEKLENQVEQGNAELRSLIAKFRAPLMSREVVASVTRLVDQFRGATGVPVYLQNEWTDDNLTPEMRANVIGIVQEALSNARKHANASNVRVLIRHLDGVYRIVVEDDGRGFDTCGKCLDQPGEQFGCGIMRQRGIQLGGETLIESEVDEGTRVSIDFEF